MSWIARRRIAVGMLSLCAFAGFAPCALAQETRATVTGTVTRRSGQRGARRDRHRAEHRHQRVDRSDDQRGGVFTVQQRSTRARQGHRGASRIQDVRPRRHHAAHRGDRHRRPFSCRSAALEETVTVSAQASAIESNESTIAADDREQAHLRAAAQRPAGLHADAAHRRHPLHADDVRRDRLLGHARMGRERIAVGPRQPHRQQRVPDRRRAELGHGRRHRVTGTTPRRSTRSRSSRSRHRASTPRSAAPAAASST